MVESITWPCFSQNFAQKDGQVINSTFFTLLLLKLFFQKSHSPCRKKKIFEKQLNTTKKKKKQMAKLLTFDGQVINSTAYIYMYVCAWCYYLGQVCFLQNTVCQKHYKNIGFSTFFLKNKIARANLRCYNLGLVGHF